MDEFIKRADAIYIVRLCMAAGSLESAPYFLAEDTPIHTIERQLAPSIERRASTSAPPTQPAPAATDPAPTTASEPPALAPAAPDRDALEAAAVERLAAMRAA